MLDSWCDGCCRRFASTVIAGCATTSLSFPNATPGKPLTVNAWEERPRGPGLPGDGSDARLSWRSRSNHEWSRWFRDQGPWRCSSTAGARASRTTRALNRPNVPDLPTRNGSTTQSRAAMASQPEVRGSRADRRDRLVERRCVRAGVNGPSLERARQRASFCPSRASAPRWASIPVLLAGERLVRAPPSS